MLNCPELPIVEVEEENSVRFWLIPVQGAQTPKANSRQLHPLVVEQILRRAKPAGPLRSPGRGDGAM